jgi:hypothetical protein
MRNGRRGEGFSKRGVTDKHQRNDPSFKGGRQAIPGTAQMQHGCVPLVLAMAPRRNIFVHRGAGLDPVMAAVRHTILRYSDSS